MIMEDTQALEADFPGRPDGQRQADSRRPAGPGLDVLVVEDDESIRAVMMELLGDSGHRPRAVASAEEALTVLAERAPDVMLTDIGLPGITGLELVREVLERMPQVTTVIASGHGRPAQAQEGVLARALYLRKPFDFGVLETMLEGIAAAPR